MYNKWLPFFYPKSRLIFQNLAWFCLSLRKKFEKLNESIKSLGQINKNNKALRKGNKKQLLLTNLNGFKS